MVINVPITGTLIENKTSIFPQWTSNEQAAFKWNDGDIMLQAIAGEDEKSSNEKCVFMWGAEGIKWFPNPIKGRQSGTLAFIISQRLIKKLCD